VLGGADVVLGSASPSDPVRAQVARDAEGGNRLVMLAKATGGLEGERLPSGLLPAAVVVLGDVLRAGVG